MAKQARGPHQGAPNSEGTTYTKYQNGRVQSLQDQADNGGWLMHGMPIHGDAPDLETMGTRGGQIKSDHDSHLYSDNS
jgi:hypothetical protein